MELRRRILIIDDDIRHLDLHRRYLERARGWSCETATSGKEGIQKLDQMNGKVDIALVDLNMPGMQGGTVAKVLRERWPRLRLIILTGSADDLDEGLKACIDGYLPKPISLNVLVAEIEKQLAVQNKERLNTFVG